MSQTITTWPNGKRIAIAINVDLEVWAEGKAPSYSVQASTVKPGVINHGGIAWSKYGGTTGVYRVLNMLKRHDITANFSVNAKCVDVFPDAVRAVFEAGHAIAGHGITQDLLLAELTPEEERAVISTSLDTLEAATGKRPKGWVTPVHAHSEHTLGFLADAGIVWHNEAAYSDVPHVVEVNGRRVVAIPGSDFTDNRVLKTAPHLLLETYKRTFNYLCEHEPMSYLGLSIHAQFGGRPLMIAVFDELITLFKSHPDAWIASHGEIAEYVLDNNLQEPANARRLARN